MEKSTAVYAKGPGAKATAELVIQNFLEVMATSKPGKGYESDTFMVGNTPMAIEVCPNGGKDEFEGHVSVYLWNKSDAALTVKCQLISEAKTWSFHMEIPAKQCFTKYNFFSHTEGTVSFKEMDFVLTANVEIPGEGLLKIMGNEDAVVPKKICVCNIELSVDVGRAFVKYLCIGVERIS